MNSINIKNHDKKGLFKGFIFPAAAVILVACCASVVDALQIHVLPARMRNGCWDIETHPWLATPMCDVRDIETRLENNVHGLFPTPDTLFVH